MLFSNNRVVILSAAKNPEGIERLRRVSRARRGHPLNTLGLPISGKPDNFLPQPDEHYPAFSSSETERSRFWTMSAVISMSFTFLLLGR